MMGAVYFTFTERPWVAWGPLNHEGIADTHKPGRGIGSRPSECISGASFWLGAEGDPEAEVQPTAPLRAPAMVSYWHSVLVNGRPTLVRKAGVHAPWPDDHDAVWDNYHYHGWGPGEGHVSASFWLGREGDPNG